MAKVAVRGKVRFHDGEVAVAKPEERAMNKDQVKGSAKQVKGKVQEIAGKAVGNKNLEARGDANKAIGKTQKAYGDAKQMAKKSSK